MSYRRIIIFAATLAVVSFSISICSARQPQVDSLTVLLSKSRDDRQKVDVLNALARQYLHSNDSIAAHYAGRSLQLAESISYGQGKKIAYTLFGIISLGKGHFADAIELFEESLLVQIAGAENDDVYALAMTGESYVALAQYDSAQRFFDRAIALGKRVDARRLTKAYNGHAKVSLLLWQNEQALLYLDSASALLDKGKPEIRWLELLSSYGAAYDNLLRQDLAQKNYNKVCAWSDSIKDVYHQIKCALNNADYQFRRANYALAMDYAKEAIGLSTNYKYPPQQVSLFLKIGEIYTEVSEFDLALNYYFNALAISEPLGLRYETAQLYTEIAWVYKDQGRYQLALEFCDRSLALREQIKDLRGIATVHNVRGLVYLLQKKYDASVREHQTALEIRRQINYPLGIAASLYNLALVYEARGELTNALQLHLDALSFSKTILNAQDLTISYNSVAGILVKLKRYEEAAGYLAEAGKLAEMTQSKIARRNNYRLYSELLEGKGDLSGALAYSKKYIEVNDSIYSETSAMKIAELQAMYDVQKKENEIELLKNQRELQSNQLQLQQARIQNQKLYTIIAGIAVLLFFLFALVLIKLNQRLYKARRNLSLLNDELQRANETVVEINKTLEQKVEERTSQLKQAYLELDTFFYRSSHDFRRPLTTFLGLADLAKMTIKDEQATELFRLVRETALYLDKMLNKLQTMGELGPNELHYYKGNVKEGVASVLESYKAEIVRRKIKVTQSYTLQHVVHSYPTLINVIVENLVENAINFSKEPEPAIKIVVVQKGAQISITVEDNGLGIPAEYQGQVFDMYFKAHYESKGNGLGLYIVKKAAEKMGGEVRLTSDVKKGSSFTIEVPAALFFRQNLVVSE